MLWNFRGSFEVEVFEGRIYTIHTYPMGIVFRPNDVSKCVQWNECIPTIADTISVLFGKLYTVVELTRNFRCEMLAYCRPEIVGWFYGVGSHLKLGRVARRINDGGRRELPQGSHVSLGP